MPTSNADIIHDGSVSIIQGLNLTLGSTPVTVVKRKVGTVEQATGAMPLISVSCSPRAGSSKLWDTGLNTGGGGRKEWHYYLQIDMSSPGNRNPLTGLPDYQSWRQTIARAFGIPTVIMLPYPDQLYDIVNDPGPVIDRGAYKGLYDESVMTLDFVTVEDSSDNNT